MNKKLVAILFGVAIAVAGFYYFGIGERFFPETEQTETALGEDARLNGFFDEVFEREVSQSPIQQAFLGRDLGMNGQWDDFSDAAVLEDLAESEADLAWLETEFTYVALSENGKLSYDLFKANLERQIRNAAFNNSFYVVDQFNGQVSFILSMMQNVHSIKNIQDAEDYISRVIGIETILREYALQLADRAANGVIAPAFSFKDVLTDVAAMGSGFPITDESRENALFSDFKAKVEALEISDEAKADLVSRLSAALSGPYQEGFNVLLAELRRIEPLADGNKGVWSLPNGEAFYQNRIKNHTTLDLTAEEIHQIGLDDVARIHIEMRAIQEAVGFEGTLQDFFGFIRTDPNNFYEDSDAGRAQFLADAQKQVDEIYAVVGDYFNTLPKARLEVRRVEPWRENSTSIAFYNSPSEDLTRPGIYYANLKDMKSVQKYVFGAITYHESVPGHHFQIALAREQEDLPSFRRFGGNNAFVEGWALYAEFLAKEMGFYKEPLYDFGRLQDEIWRSVRLVVDTGIHAKGWTRQQSIDYFMENTPISEGDIITEVERYFVNPGQALGYKMGMLKILQLRRKAETELGDKFDIREFHDVVIGKGAMTLPILEREVNKYIAVKGAE